MTAMLFCTHNIPTKLATMSRQAAQFKAKSSHRCGNNELASH